MGCTYVPTPTPLQSLPNTLCQWQRHSAKKARMFVSAYTYTSANCIVKDIIIKVRFMQRYLHTFWRRQFGPLPLSATCWKGLNNILILYSGFSPNRNNVLKQNTTIALQIIFKESQTLVRMWRIQMRHIKNACSCPFS